LPLVTDSNIAMINDAVDLNTTVVLLLLRAKLVAKDSLTLPVSLIQDLIPEPLAHPDLVAACTYPSTDGSFGLTRLISNLSKVLTLPAKTCLVEQHV
jgi:hypothetical protein